MSVSRVGEVNELKYLFRSGSAVTRAEANAFSRRPGGTSDQSVISRLHLTTLIALRPPSGRSAVVRGIAVDVKLAVRSTKWSASWYLLLICGDGLAMAVAPSMVSVHPVMHGTWRGRSLSSGGYRDGQAIPPTEAYAAITQTASSIRIRLMTAESESELLGASIMRRRRRVAAFVGDISNTPRQEFRHRARFLRAALSECHGSHPIFWKDNIGPIGKRPDRNIQRSL